MAKFLPMEVEWVKEGDLKGMVHGTDTFLAEGPSRETLMKQIIRNKSFYFQI